MISAQTLDVGTMSLYHYILNKDALLDGIVEFLMLEIELPAPADGSWDQRALRMARSLREVALRHPNCVPLMVTRLFATPAALVPANAAFALLAEAGLDAEQAPHHVPGPRRLRVRVRDDGVSKLLRLLRQRR